MLATRLVIVGVACMVLTFFAGAAIADDVRPAPQAMPRPQVGSSRDHSPVTDVDLRPQIEKLGLAVRDQGHRGTCSVFATTFLIEYHFALTSGERHLDLSEEYLNWAKNRANQTAFDGGMFKDIIRGFEEYGIVPGTQMPYQTSFRPEHPQTPSPPVVASGKQFGRFAFTFIKRWDNQKGMSEQELQATLATLRAGRPVATGIWWLKRFDTLAVEHVPLLKEYPRTENEHSDSSKNPMFDGHSIDLVGYHIDSAFPGGGYFVFRNSFGAGFGQHGYGFVSFQYIRDYANDAICINSDQ